MWHMSYSCGWDFFSFLFFASIWKCICTWYNFRLSRFVVYLKAQFYIQLKFGFSEKATKFEKIFVVLLLRASCSVRATAYFSQSQRRFFKTNVDKSYNTNFTYLAYIATLFFQPEFKSRVVTYFEPNKYFKVKTDFFS